MEFYKDKKDIYLIISKKDIIKITSDLDNERKNYICTYDLKDKLHSIEKCNIYEIIFNNKLKKDLLSNEKNIPYDIVENCMKCNYYSSCKYNKDQLKKSKQTNKILKEYKDFINSLKRDDNNEN